MISETAPHPLLGVLAPVVKIGAVTLLGGAVVRLYRRGLPPEVESGMLQNVWVVVSIYVAAVAADMLLSVGHTVSSVAGLVTGLVASQSVLVIVKRQGWLQTREHLLHGWALLGVGGLVVQPHFGGLLMNFWVLLWLICATMCVYNGVQINAKNSQDPKDFGV